MSQCWWYHSTCSIIWGMYCPFCCYISLSPVTKVTDSYYLFFMSLSLVLPSFKCCFKYILLVAVFSILIYSMSLLILLYRGGSRICFSMNLSIGGLRHALPGNIGKLMLYIVAILQNSITHWVVIKAQKVYISYTVTIAQKDVPKIPCYATLWITILRRNS